MESKFGLCYADGGSRGNPGPAGIGATLQNGAGETVATVSESIGIATNNVAEYTALIRILEKALELGYDDLDVRMDSELVVKQIKGEYKVKHEALAELFDVAKALTRRFKFFRISHVRREMNKDADRLANEAMDQAAAAKKTSK